MYCVMVEKELSSAGRIWLSRVEQGSERGSRDCLQVQLQTVQEYLKKEGKDVTRERKNGREYEFGAEKLAKYELL